MRIKLSADTVRRLVVVHTALLAIIVLAGLAGLAFAVRNERVRNTIRAIISKEKQQSALLERLGGDDANAATLDHWSLEIAPQDMRDLQVLTESLREAQALTDADKRWYPATLRMDGEAYDGKVRLRGDLDSHWRGTKKSWRFRVKGDRYPRGYREIDLIIPYDKGYEVEMMSYEVARELGLFAPDAGFVNVDLNGVDLGAYLWREPPGKEALERLQYPEGEIFAEQNTWIQEFFSGRGLYRLYSPPVSFFPANWEPDVHRDVPVAGYFAQRWNTLLSLITLPSDDAGDARFARELPNLIDLDKYLTWNALTWLFGSTHSHWGDNLSWYYDNTTGRFEPLLYDVFRYPLENDKLGTFEHTEHDELALRVLHHAPFRQRRNAILWRLVTEDAYDLARRSAEAGTPLRPHLVRGIDAPSLEEVETFQQQTLTILDANRTLIRGHLAFGRLFMAPELDVVDERPLLRVRLVPDALAELALASLVLHLAPNVGDAAPFLSGEMSAVLRDPRGVATPVVVEVTRTPTLDQRIEVPVDEDGEAVVEAIRPAITVRFASPIALTTPVDERLAPRMGTYVIELPWPDVDVATWRTPGTIADMNGTFEHGLSGEPLPASHVFRASPAYAFAASAPPPGGEVEAASGNTGGLRWHRADGVVIVEPGIHRLTEDVVLPWSGHTLRLEAGTRLEMAPGVSLVHRGPLEVRGTATQPVSIVAADDRRPWGGIGIIGAETRSRVEHLHVRGGGEDWVDGIFLSGQLCFYSSDVDLDAVAILDARADDGLNVKRADVDIRNSTFSGNAFDAFDGDWVTGTVAQSRFVDNGGDGIDVSGATLMVRSSLFARQGDKSLSIGERSEVVGVNLVVRDSVVGVAVKDRSRAHIVSSVLYGNQTAVTAYRKKPIFGGGDGVLVSSLLWGNGIDYEVDDESSVRLLGVGHEAFESQPRLSASDNRVAPMAVHYRKGSEIEFTFVGDTGSPFARGSKLDAADLPALDDLGLPAFDTIPLGLITPLDLTSCPAIPASS